jgi:predicted GNAT family acetyltransferase
MRINIYDENEDYINDLQIRIADHSQNPKNNRNDYTLSFVIANNNPTENKFYPFGEEYYYDDNSDIEDIKEQIRGIIDDKIENIKEKNYVDGGSVLLAPNGKPSNLTSEQYKLVRTSAFKQWFGDWENNPSQASKVVDENGEPLVVYHGSNVEFNIFDKRKIGFNTTNALRGFYFTDNSSVANSYTYDENVEEYLGNVIEVFLYGNKIKTIDAENKDWVEFSETSYIDKEIKKAFEIGYDCVMVKNIYDPFIDMENGTDYYGNNFVVDNPNQIKLADGSNTTFDGNNPDIRFDGGGELKYKNKGAYADVTEVNNKEWYLNMIEAEIEGKGYAKKIMNQIIQDAKNKKVEKIILDASLMNKDYFEYGYGFDEISYNDDDGLYRMELKLN